MQETQFNNPYFAICLNNEGYEVSLSKGKIYSMVPDADAHQQGLIRIIDESGEEYAFDLNRFYLMELPSEVKEILLAPAKQLIG